MTNDNNTRTKVNAVFFSVLMVVSMVAVGFAAAPAAADVTAVTGQNAEDVSLGQTSAAQDVSFTVTDDGSNDTQSLTLDVSAAENNGIGVSLDQSNVSTNATGVDSVTDNGNTIDIGLNTSGNGAANDFSVDATLVHDTSGADNTAAQLNPVSFTLTDDRNGNTGTVSFDLTTTNRVTSGDNVQIANNSLVFQGEEDIVFTADDGSTVPASNLEGTSGDREGVPLRVPVPEDASPGRYTGPSGFSTTVQSPSIDTAEVRLNDNDISQIGAENAYDRSGTTFRAYAEYNFDDAEDVSVTVEDPSGSDITGEVTPSGDVITSDGSGVPLDFRGEDAGEYTLIFEGNDNLDHDAVIEEYTLELTDQDQLSLEVDEDPITQGSNNEFTVSGGTNGQQHVVAIQSDDFRDGSFNAEDYQSIFRNVGDTEVTGVVNGATQYNTSDTSPGSTITAEYAYAVVEIDGTTATGSINTGLLSDTSVDVDVYNASSVDEAVIDSNDLVSSDDDSFEVEEGDVALNSPTGAYTVGEEVSVSGTATSADRVGIYVQDNDNWDPVNIDGDQYINVDSDDSFEEEDVVLSNGDLAGSTTLSFAGRYDIGVIDAADVASSIVNSDESIDSSDFSSASSSRYSITVTEGDLSGNFTTVNGQVAVEDNTIDVQGVAQGQDNVVVAFVDDRGQTEAVTVSVDGDGTFDREDIPLDNLRQGTVSGHIISQGRDGAVGNGDSLPGTSNPATIDGLRSYIDDDVGSGSGDQIRSRILSNTVDADGSDDLIVSTTFRLNDATLSLDSVYPEEAQADGLNPVATGETLVVDGATNRQSEDNSITFEMLTQEGDSVASASTSEWGNDGQFSASIDTSDLETGTYILEADDGDSTDRVEVEIVEERQQPDDGEDGADDGEDGADDGEDGADDGEDGADDGDDGMDDGEDGADDGEDGADDGEDGADDGEDGEDGDDGTDDSTPGFGALVALVALIAAALLATRRND